MSEKSYVSVEQQVCPICTKKHDTGVLLDRRLKDSLERTTVTGWSLCPSCKEKEDQGFTALVEIDKSKSDSLSPDGVYRLGRIIHVRNVPWASGTLAWVPTEVIDKLIEANQDHLDTT